MRSVLLVGAGKLAIEYAKVLREMDVPTTVVGRGAESAQKFETATKMPVIKGGIKKWLNNTNKFPEFAIVAVGIDELSNTAYALLDKGFRTILIEKPGGLNYPEINLIVENTKKHNADVFIAYNRRFYSSVREAKKIIKKDGGIKSFIFEFTEWRHEIESLGMKPEILKNWLLGNSSHVIDLAFYLGGVPKKLSCYTGGYLEWHPDGCIFVGAGITEKNAFFSYYANWDAPGRWSIEIITENNRLIFRPLEKLKMQKKNSVAINEININNDLDVRFKPGLYLQVKTFLNRDYSEFCDIYQQLSHLKFYERILKGNRLNNKKS